MTDGELSGEVAITWPRARDAGNGAFVVPTVGEILIRDWHTGEPLLNAVTLKMSLNTNDDDPMIYAEIGQLNGDAPSGEVVTRRYRVVSNEVTGG